MLQTITELQPECLSHTTISLTVQGHVLGEALAEDDLVSVIDQHPEPSCISVQVSRGKTLVGHVYKHRVVPCLWGITRKEGRGREGGRERGREEGRERENEMKRVRI